MAAGVWPKAEAAAAHSEYCSFDSDSEEDELETYMPIIHPFGRGQFREMAEKAVIPDVLLKKLQNKSTWTGQRGVLLSPQLPCAVTRSRGRGRAQILQPNPTSNIRPGMQQQDYSPMAPSPPPKQCPPVLKPGGYSGESDMYLSEFSSSDSSSCTGNGSTHLWGRGRGSAQKTTYTLQNKSYASATKKRQRPRTQKSPGSFHYSPRTNEDFYSNKTK